MKIYDISQEIFNCEIYPKDPAPERKIISSIDRGDLYNLTSFSMCAHNGTHIDAPSHFIKNGKTVTDIDLGKLIGYAYVTRHSGVLTDEDAYAIIKKAEETNPEAAKRILISGNATVSNEAAEAFVKNGILLIGNESQTVGPEKEPMAVHLILLRAETVILEGIRLQGIPEGVYLLSAAPIHLGGCDGAPCRAVLISLE